MRNSRDPDKEVSEQSADMESAVVFVAIINAGTRCKFRTKYAVAKSLRIFGSNRFQQNSTHAHCKVSFRRKLAVMVSLDRLAA